MPQITFRLPENETEFLKWYSEKTAQPVSTIYRNSTMDHYQEWKLNVLLDEYKRGAINIKTICKLTDKSFHEALLLLEKHQIEPPISQIMDEYTSSVRAKLTPKSLFKDGKVPKRESPVMKFDKE